MSGNFSSHSAGTDLWFFSFAIYFFFSDVFVILYFLFTLSFVFQ